MNPRQRRGAVFILLAGAGALAVFLMVANYVGNVNSQVSPMIEVYRVVDDIPAYGEIDAENVELVEIPERYAPPQALRDGSELSGERVSFNVGGGTLLGTDMLLERSALNATEREIAIEVDAVTGIAGRVASGEFVDIYAVFETGERSGNSQVLVRNVRVVSVGGLQTRSRSTSEGALREQDLLPVTVALSPADALRVTYADSFAVSVRLVGLPPGIQNQDRTNEPGSIDARSLRLGNQLGNQGDAR